jgi:hypothetical protein
MGNRNVRFAEEFPLLFAREHATFRLFHHFRRLVIRWEHPVENFFGMVRLGGMQILLRN